MSNVVDTINKGDKEEPSINSKPVLIKTEFLSKETDSITVKAVGTDEDNELLTYTLYVQEEGGEWQEGQTLKEASIEAGTELTASGLKEYTYYNWRVDVTDNIATTVTGTMQERVRTFCPGNILNCTDGSCSNEDCTECSKTGIVPKTCNRVWQNFVWRYRRKRTLL